MPFIKTFKPADYNGESQNWGFIQSDDGIMYIANTIGITEYDGVSWRHFKADNDGIPLSFAKDDNGVIYAGGTGFMGMLVPDSIGQMTFVSLTSYLPEDFFIDFIWSINFLNGKVYFQNKSNILSWDGEAMSIIDSPSDIEFISVTGDRAFVDTNSGLYELKNDQLMRLPWASELNDYTLRVINKLSSDSLLIGTYGQGVYIYTDGDLHYLDNEISKFFSEHLLPVSLSLPDGKLLLATKKAGALILNNDLSIYYRISSSGGLANDDIKTFYLDKDNNIWIGTDNGYSILPYPIEFTFFDSRVGVSSTIEEIRSFQNEIVIGSFLGVHKLVPKTSAELLGNRPYAEFAKIEGTGLNNFALIENNDALLISTTQGTQVYNGSSIKLFDSKEARKFYRSDRNPNVIYAGYRNGCDILIFNNTGLQERIPISDLDVQIRGIAEDTDGSVWLGSLSNGVYRVTFDTAYQTNSLEHFGEEDGLPSLRDNLVYRVNDRIFFTTHQGIFRFDESIRKFVPDSTFGDIYADRSRFVYAFHFDDENAWINSFRKKEMALAIPNEEGNYELDIAGFTTIHNMQIYEIFKEKHGSAWFGGSDGLARYEPSEYQTDSQEFSAKIRGVILNGDSTLFNGHLNEAYKSPVLNYDNNELRFETAALYFDEQNDYQYLLDGYDEEWSSWSREPFKIYTNLGFGNYSFKVRAKNIKGEVSSIDSFEFKILAPWYLTWWFITIAIFVFTLIMIYIGRYFASRKLIRRVEELELIQKAQKQRERISRDLHDNVGSNLTYIISSLDYLSYKSDSDKEVSEKANNLSGFTRDTLHQLRDTIWHISSSTVTVKRFAKRIEEMCLRLAEIKEDTRWTIKVFGPEDYVLQPLPALNMFRVVQEAVNNAYKYAEADLIVIKINVKPDVFEISVIDDGIGFEFDTADRDGHYGLVNMQTRMEDIGAELKIDSIIEEGTTIRISYNL